MVVSNTHLLITSGFLKPFRQERKETHGFYVKVKLKHPNSRWKTRPEINIKAKLSSPPATFYQMFGICSCSKLSVSSGDSSRLNSGTR